MVLFIVAAADFGTMAFPAFDATLADLTDPENRQSAFSLLYFGANIGMAISPIVGGLLFKDHLSLLFFLERISAAFLAISAAFLLSLLPVFLYQRQIHRFAKAGKLREK